MSSHPRTSLRQSGSSTAAPNATSGSRTITESSVGPSIPIPTLHLRGAEPRQQQARGRRIQWAEDVVDNEGMGKKSSKVCCIYHKPHEPGDSESDESSSDESDSDGEPDLSRARKAGGKGRGRRHQHGHGDEDGGEGKGGQRKASPNAYERQPKHKNKTEG